MSEHNASKAATLRALPSVDQLLRTEAAIKNRRFLGTQRITAIAREVTEKIRAEIQASDVLGQATAPGFSREQLLAEAVRKLEEACEKDSTASLRRVINATGVILHTNLGRAPLAPTAREAILREAGGYCTLEYDVTSGSRGRRGARVEELLIELTGSEDALVVNNCAAAALLILKVLAADGETIVSRGELVEIGGDFRVPDVMANSGTTMVEVGTTNRTRLDDYRRAINEKTRLIMRVHQSNYRIIGFTASPTRSNLASLAHEAGLLLYEDAGSGALSNLNQFGLEDEPIIRNCISDGADVVTFSGDKLLGSAQAGLVVGRREVIERLRKHSLFRALRVDKLTLAALEFTLDAYRRGVEFEEIPVLRMLSQSQEEIEARARDFLKKWRQQAGKSDVILDVISGESAVGGGSGPNTHPPTTLIAVNHQNLSPDELERRLRQFSPPVISRISDGKILLDLRTVEPDEELSILQALASLNT